MKAAVAARVAARLAKNPRLDVKKQKGSLGELRVTVDGKDVVDTLWYPTPTSIIAKVNAYIGAS